MLAELRMKRESAVVKLTEGRTNVQKRRGIRAQSREWEVNGNQHGRSASYSVCTPIQSMAGSVVQSWSWLPLLTDPCSVLSIMSLSILPAIMDSVEEARPKQAWSATNSKVQSCIEVVDMKKVE